MTRLSDLAVGQHATIEHLGGERAFRRRLMELGLVPGTSVELVGVAPLGDPLKLVVRGCILSIRRAEAADVGVTGTVRATAESLVEAPSAATAPVT